MFRSVLFQLIEEKIDPFLGIKNDRSPRKSPWRNIKKRTERFVEVCFDFGFWKAKNVSSLHIYRDLILYAIPTFNIAHSWLLSFS